MDIHFTTLDATLDDSNRAWYAGVRLCEYTDLPQVVSVHGICYRVIAEVIREVPGLHADVLLQRELNREDDLADPERYTAMREALALQESEWTGRAAILVPLSIPDWSDDEEAEL